MPACGQGLQPHRGQESWEGVHAQVPEQRRKARSTSSTAAQPHGILLPSSGQASHTKLSSTAPGGQGASSRTG